MEGKTTKEDEAQETRNPKAFWPYARWGVCIIGLIVLLFAIKSISTYSKCEEIEYTDYVVEEVSESGAYKIEVDLHDVAEHYDLMIRSAQQEITVKSGEEIIYEYVADEKQSLLEMPQSKWHLIELELEQTENIITIEYYSSYSAYEDYEPLIYYGSSEELLGYANIVSFPACMVAWLFILLGFLILFVCYLYKAEEVARINYMAIFLLAFGLWSWGEAKSLWFNYTDLYWQSLITLTLGMLVPIPFMMYMKSSVQKVRDRKILDAYIALCILDTIVGWGLTITGTMDLMEYIRVPQMILVLGVIFLVYMSIKREEEWLKVTSGKWRQVAVLIILFVIAVFEIRCIYIEDIFQAGLYMKVGVLVFVLLIVENEILKMRELHEVSEQAKDEMREELDKANVYLMTDKMTPHFMHNSLLAIQELCYSDPEEAANAIGIFSRYIRINLEGIGESELIPFEKELEYLKLYMAIQQLCYEDDIQFELDIQVNDFYVPPFSVEPIIENAVVHGVRKTRRQGKVALRTWNDGGDVVIQVTDNGVGFQVTEEEKRKFSSSVAVVYRIEKVLGGNFDIDSEVGKGTTVTLRIPRVNKGE